MWLAAYAEGVAMGWVSFYKKSDVRETLHMPLHIEPVALISLGFTDNYPQAPFLEKENWEKRVQINDLIHYDNWTSSKHNLFK
jgi:5,6-dimethylbenzimidazole synthase